MTKYYKFEDKVYKVYETSSDSFHVKESGVPESVGGTFIYGSMAIGLIWCAAKMLRLI